MSRKFVKHTVLTILSIAVLLGLLVYAIIGNTKNRDIIGTWVTDTAGIETGFQCGFNGIAASINNDTCQYNLWETSRNKLILKGKRFVDNNVYDFSDTMEIVSIDDSELSLKRNGKVVHYLKSR